MNQLSIMTLLYRLGVLAERVAWWAYDRSSRLREEQIHRMAADKARSPGVVYGFERSSPRVPAPDAAWVEEALEAHLGLRDSVATSSAASTAPAPPVREGNLRPIRPVALSTSPKASEAEADLTARAEKPRRAALG